MTGNVFGDLIYDGCPLDRAPPRRRDEADLSARLTAADTRFVAIANGKSLIRPDKPALVPLVGAAGAAMAANGAQSVYLGDDATGASWFAVDVAAEAEQRLVDAQPGARFADLRTVGAALDRDDGTIFAYARAMVHWHRHHRFCGLCGRPTASREGGHARACTDDACGRVQFPRTDPVVIMLVTRPGADGGACLLGRQHGWSSGLLSTLAGFVEPGESLERAVMREIREEVGLTDVVVRYVASQPWPFPASLMLGFVAEAPPSATIVVDDVELEEARWLSRADLAAHTANGGRLPFRGTMARTLIDAWRLGTERACADATPNGDP